MMSKFQFVAYDHSGNELYREVAYLPKLVRLIWLYAKIKGSLVGFYLL
jgi:hypothetical protein